MTEFLDRFLDENVHFKNIEDTSYDDVVVSEEVFETQPEVS